MFGKKKEKTAEELEVIKALVLARNFELNNMIEHTKNGWHKSAKSSLATVKFYENEIRKRNK